SRVQGDFGSPPLTVGSFLPPPPSILGKAGSFSSVALASAICASSRFSRSSTRSILASSSFCCSAARRSFTSSFRSSSFCCSLRRRCVPSRSCFNRATSAVSLLSRATSASLLSSSLLNLAWVVIHATATDPITPITATAIDTFGDDFGSSATATLRNELCEPPFDQSLPSADYCRGGALRWPNAKAQRPRGPDELWSGNGECPRGPL